MLHLQVWAGSCEIFSKLRRMDSDSMSAGKAANGSAESGGAAAKAAPSLRSIIEPCKFQHCHTRGSQKVFKLWIYMFYRPFTGLMRFSVFLVSEHRCMCSSLSAVHQRCVYNLHMFIAHVTNWPMLPDRI